MNRAQQAWPGLATCLKNDSMIVSLRGFLNKPCTLQIHSSIQIEHLNVEESVAET